MANATLTDLLGTNGILLRYNAADTAKIWSDVSKTTSITDGATVKNWQPSSGTLSAEMTEATNGPTYRSNYNSTGFAGVQFDGSNDVLRNAASGLTTAKFHCLCVCTPLAASSSMVWNRGGGSNYCGLLANSSTSIGLFSSVGSTSNITVTAGRVVTLISVGTGQNIIDTVESAAGVGGSSRISPSTDATLSFGAFLNGGTPSLFAACVIHDLLMIDGTVERGQVIRAQKYLSNLWSVTNPDAVPQTAGGMIMGGGFRGGIRRGN